MPTDQNVADYIVNHLAPLGEVRASRMFGEFGVYYRDKLVALICNDLLFVKCTAAGRAYLGPHEEDRPHPGAKPCFLLSVDEVEDGERLRELIRLTYEDLPPQK